MTEEHDSSVVLWNDFDAASSVVSDYSPMSSLLHPVNQSTPLRSPQLNSPLRKRRRLELPLELSMEFCDSFDDPSHDSLTFNDFEDPHHQAASSSQGLSQSSNASQLLGSTCCESRCLASLNLLEVESCRSNFQSHSTMEQQQFLLDTISLTASQDGKFRYLTLAGKQLCKIAFNKVLNISEKRLRKVNNLYRQEGATISQKAVRRDRPKSSKHSSASAWMERYFNRIGDKMPHLEQIHLPHFLSKKTVYELMTLDLKDQGICGNEIISSSHFYALWRQDYRNCIIPKQNLFSKCDVCVRFASERLKVAGDKSRTEQLKREYKQHLKLVEAERCKYYHHREKSRSEPTKYLTIIIDGMDQNKTNVPHLTQTTKSTQNLWRVRTHLTGSLVHTKAEKGKIVFAFFDLLQWPHDSNLTITVLVAILKQLCSKFEYLPTTLYLQLDNTSRENKNKYVMAFLAYLIQLKIFKKIRVNFLPVGHTHEDVDQFFSKVSTQINRVGAETIDGLMKVTAQSFTPQPITILLESIHDVRSWLSPYIDELHGHSLPHCFRFTLNEDGQAVMHYKNWSHDEWSKEGVFLLENVPEGLPLLSHPSSDKQDVQQLKLDMPKWKPWLSDRSWEEWTDFLESGIRCLNEASSHNPEWSLQILKDKAGISDCVIQQNDLGQDTILLARERQQCEVYTGSRRKKSLSTDADLSSLDVGDLVAVFCENYTREPVVGRCLKIFEDNIEVAWMEGSYTSSWKPWKVRDQNNRRKLVDWVDCIPKLSIVLFGFKLTATSHLRKKTIDNLKKEYSKVKQQESANSNSHDT